MKNQRRSKLIIMVIIITALNLISPPLMLYNHLGGEYMNTTTHSFPRHLTLIFIIIKLMMISLLHSFICPFPSSTSSATKRSHKELSRKQKKKSSKWRWWGWIKKGILSFHPFRAWITGVVSSSSASGNSFLITRRKEHFLCVHLLLFFLIEQEGIERNREE